MESTLIATYRLAEITVYVWREPIARAGEERYVGLTREGRPDSLDKRHQGVEAAARHHLGDAITRAKITAVAC
jgi:hypothetical protein